MVVAGISPSTCFPPGGDCCCARLDGPDRFTRQSRSCTTSVLLLLPAGGTAWAGPIGPAPATSNAAAAPSHQPPPPPGSCGALPELGLPHSHASLPIRRSQHRRLFLPDNLPELTQAACPGNLVRAVPRRTATTSAQVAAKAGIAIPPRHSRSRTRCSDVCFAETSEGASAHYQLCLRHVHVFRRKQSHPNRADCGSTPQDSSSSRLS